MELNVANDCQRLSLRVKEWGLLSCIRKWSQPGYVVCLWVRAPVRERASVMRLTPDWTLWVSYSLSDAARALVWAQMISTIPLEILSIQIWLINWFTNSLCWPIWAPICSTAGKLNVYIWHLEKFLWHDINTLSNKIRILQISSNTSLGHLEWISGIDYTRTKMIVHGQKQGCFGLKSW